MGTTWGRGEIPASLLQASLPTAPCPEPLPSHCQLLCQGQALADTGAWGAQDHPGKLGTVCEHLGGVGTFCGHLESVGTSHLGLGQVENVCECHGSMRTMCRQLVCWRIVWTARKYGHCQWVSREHGDPRAICAHVGCMVTSRSLECLRLQISIWGQSVDVGEFGDTLGTEGAWGPSEWGVWRQSERLKYTRLCGCLECLGVVWTSKVCGTF